MLKRGLYFIVFMYQGYCLSRDGHLQIITCRHSLTEINLIMIYDYYIHN